MQREICGCSDLRATFGLSEAARTNQHSAMTKAYGQAVKARGEVPYMPSPEWLDRAYMRPITSGLTACGGWAGKDFKLIVGTALLELTVAEGGLDIIYVKTRGGDGQGYCVLVTEAGAERIVAVARSMKFEAAERWRASKPPKGAEADAAKHDLDALAELGLTNIFGQGLLDTRSLTPGQLDKALAATWAIRQATVSGGDAVWVAINALVQAAGAPPPSLAMDAAPPPQLVGVQTQPALAGPGDTSDAETEVGDTGGGGPSGGEAALPLMPAAPLQPSGAPPAPAFTPAPSVDGVAAGKPRPDAETLKAAAEADSNAAAARGAAAGTTWSEATRKAHNHAAKAAASPPVPEAVAPVAPKAVPHALAPPPATTSASRKRKAGAASGDAPQLMEAMEAQDDAPVEPLPPASPPTPEEATQRLREALASGDEGAAALALEALEAVTMTKATLRSTGAMSLPNAHASMPLPRHLVPNRRGQGRQ